MNEETSLVTFLLTRLLFLLPFYPLFNVQTGCNLSSGEQFARLPYSTVLSFIYRILVWVPYPLQLPLQPPSSGGTGTGTDKTGQGTTGTTKRLVPNQ